MKSRVRSQPPVLRNGEVYDCVVSSQRSTRVRDDNAFREVQRTIDGDLRCFNGNALKSPIITPQEGEPSNQTCLVLFNRQAERYTDFSLLPKFQEVVWMLRYMLANSNSAIMMKRQSFTNPYGLVLANGKGLLFQLADELRTLSQKSCEHDKGRALDSYREVIKDFEKYRKRVSVLQSGLTLIQQGKLLTFSMVMLSLMTVTDANEYMERLSDLRVRVRKIINIQTSLADANKNGLFMPFSGLGLSL